MTDVTLTAAMRANLYSLQQTAQLMATTQQRLSTGKKVNSALDNPQNYFSALALTNRANDISSLLDGMSQAIQAITTASNGITTAQSIVSQMKSVANSAAQSLTSASNANGTNAIAYVPQGTSSFAEANGSTLAVAADSGLLVNLSRVNGTTPLGITAGATLSVTTSTAGAIVSSTFTVGSYLQTGAAGNGGGATLNDLITWLNSQTGANGGLSASITANGTIAISGNGASTETLSGSLVTALGLTTTVTSAATATSTISLNSATVPSAATALTTANDYQYNMTSLYGDTGLLNILNGDQMTVQVGSGATYTFTVGASAVNNGVQGNGGGSTLADLSTWLKTITGSTLAFAAFNAGPTAQMSLSVVTGGVTIAGNLATTLGFTTTANAATVLSANVVAGASFTNQAAATGSTLLSNLTDANGLVLYQTGGTTGGTSAGNYLTLQVGGGTARSINITATTTVQNLLDDINGVGGLTATLDAQGNLKVSNTTSATVTVSGTASGLVGASTIAANSSSTKAIYAGYGQVNAQTLPTTDLVNLQPPSGINRLADGDLLTVTIGGVTNTITVKSHGYANSSTQVSTVQGLLNSLGQIAGVTASLDSTTGQLSVTASGGSSITFGGTAATKLSLPPTVAAGQSSAATSGVSSAVIAQFDNLRTQLDQMVQDANYQGINLISSTQNNPLTVTFDEKAVNAASLVVNSVDDSSKGLGITAASGAWKDTASIQASISTLTTAQTTLRTQASTFGQNLTTVQTRQDFANQMINTLKAGSDSLTLADMNQESANMLALQTRSQLGTQALSLANQANQSVLRLFG